MFGGMVITTRDRAVIILEGNLTTGTRWRVEPLDDPIGLEGAPQGQGGVSVAPTAVDVLVTDGHEVWPLACEQLRSVHMADPVDGVELVPQRPEPS